MSRRIEDGLTNEERYRRRRIASAIEVPCACGCGEQISNIDKWGKSRRFVTGHGIQNPAKTAKHREAQRRYRDRRPAGAGREDKKERYRKFKIRAINLLGGYCFHCELIYDGTNAAVFDFHHVDPSYKEGSISSMLINKSWEATLVELNKCDLLCKNCHALHHAGGW